MKVTLAVRGAANAQAVFDFLNGNDVTWREPKLGLQWHTMAFEYPSPGLAEAAVKAAFHPRMKHTVKAKY